MLQGWRLQYANLAHDVGKMIDLGGRGIHERESHTADAEAD